MNYFIFLAAIISLGAVIVHFTLGWKIYLKPVLDSGIDLVPKKGMQSVFHCVSVFLILATLVLFAGSHRSCPLYDYVHHMVRFIAVVYAFFAIVQLIIALTSGLPGGMLKLFQWMFWGAIAVLAIIGCL